MFDQFAKIGRDLFLLNLNDARSGNMSVRNENQIIITSRGASLCDLDKKDVLSLDLDSQSGDEAASRDLNIHRAIYKNFLWNAIIHVHSPNATTLSITENKIILQDAKGQSLFPYGVPIIRIQQNLQTQEIGKILSQILNSSYRAFVLKGHGAYVLAKDILEAFEFATCLENSCKIIIATKILFNKQQPQKAPEHHKRSAIPPSIGVMDRRTTGFRRDMKR